MPLLDGRWDTFTRNSSAEQRHHIMKKEKNIPHYHIVRCNEIHKKGDIVTQRGFAAIILGVMMESKPIKKDKPTKDQSVKL